MTPGTRRLITACLLALGVAAPMAAVSRDVQAPTWPAQPLRQHQEGDLVNIAFQVTEHAAGGVTYSATGLPAGLTINATTGTVSGTLTEGSVDTTNPLEPVGRLDGAAGTHTVTLTATKGASSSQTTFTWRVSRFRKGDLFAGIGKGRYEVFDENGNFKYLLISEEEGTEWWDSGSTTGCGYNWFTRKMYFTAFDVDQDPAVVEIDPVPASLDASTAFPRNRISTYRDTGLERGGTETWFSVDNAPESVTFGVQMNWGPDHQWGTEDDFAVKGAGPDGVIGTDDDVRTQAGEAPMSFMYVGHAGGSYNSDWMAADNQDRPIFVLVPNSEGVPVAYYANESGGQLLDGTGSPIPYPGGGINRQGILERAPGVPYPGNPRPLIQWGNDLQRFTFDRDTLAATRTAVFEPHGAYKGVDWSDLASDQRTLYYTSEWGYIYRYDVGPGLPGNDPSRQLAEFTQVTGQQTLYALRLLPPGDGTGGLVVAAPTALMRLDKDGRVLTMYDAPGIDTWFALNITPDGRHMWSAETQTGKLYKWEISSGKLLASVQTRATAPAHNPGRKDLDGLCIMGEYTAAQEICGDGVDNDEDGLIDELCMPIEACSTSSPGDDDGDGLVDYNDPDCGATTSVCASSGYTDASIAGYCARHNYEGDNVVLNPAPVPPAVTESYEISGVELTGGNVVGLPPGITFSTVTGVATGTPQYETISNDATAPRVRTWRITVGVTRRNTSNEIIAEYDHQFDWTIENRNRAPIATAHTLGARPNAASSINAVTDTSTAAGGQADTDPDAEDIARLQIVSVTQPANGKASFTGNVVTYTPAQDYKGPDSFTYTISDGRDPALTSTATISIVMTNQPPVVEGEQVTTRPGLTVDVNVLDNDQDADPDGDPLTLTLVSTPPRGTFVDLGNGNYRYTPPNPYTGLGNEEINYRLTDPFGESAPGRVLFTVINTRPVGVDDAAATRPGVPVSVSVFTNDTDPDNDPDILPAGPDPKLLISFTQPLRGTVTENNGVFTYTSSMSPVFTGVDSFTYTFHDSFGGVSGATVRITVANNPPVAVNDSGSTRPGLPVTIPILPNDSDPDATDTLTVTSTTEPSNGTKTCAAGQCTYTSNAGFVGTDSFQYTITDGFGAFATATVTVTVLNQPPDAVDDAASTRPGIPVDVAVLGNDSDPDNAPDVPPSGPDPMNITAHTTPANGTVSRSGNVFTYTPNAGFVGTDSFTYTIVDTFGGSDTATVRITSVNQPPDAVDDTASTRPGQAVNISVLANDTDPDNAPDVPPSGPDPMNITVHTSPANGTVSRSGDVFTYTPNAGFVGTDSFTYTIVDTFGGSDTATVTITSRNNPPVALDNEYSVIAGQTLPPFNVQTDAPADPADPDGDTVTIASFTQPGSGTVTRLPNGTFQFQQPNGYSGVTTFTYTVTDGFGGTDTALVTIRVINNPPVAVNDSATTNGTRPVTISVLVNDSDPDSHVIAVTGATTPSNGSVVVNANGTITYTANAGFQGTDTFFYTIRDGFGGESTARVTVTVGPPNRFDDCTCATARANPGEIWPPNHKQTQVVNITNLVDPDSGAPLTVRVLGIYQDEPTNYLGDGETTIDAGGVGTSSAWVRAERTGNPNVPGNGRVYEIVFEATAADGSHCQGSVFTGVPHDQGQGSYIFDDGIRYDSTVAGGPIVRNALKIESGLTDADVTAREFTAKYIAEARIGNSFSSTTREMLLGPASDTDADTENFLWNDNQDVLFLLWRTGSAVHFKLITSDQFEYVSESIACTGEECNDIFIRAQTAANASISLRSLNLNGVSIPDTLTIAAGGEARSLHLSGLMLGEGALLSGIVKIDWTGTRPSGSAVNFKVQVGKACPTGGTTGGGGGGTPPLARTDTYATQEDTPLIVSAADGVLTNDLTFAGALTASLVDPPSNGTVTQNANGSFTYTPNPGFNGQDTYRYRVNDGSLYSDPALVTILVTPVIDPPVAVNDSATTPERTPVTIAVLGNDSDWDGGAVTLTSITSQPSNGTAMVSGSGIVYTPANGFTGTDTFTYTITGDEGTATATVTVTVTNVNEPPVAVNNSYTTQEDTPLTVPSPGIAANDSDPDAGDTFVAVLVTNPSNGTLTLNANGSFTYTPNANFSGTDSYTYRVRDAGGLESNIATVTITIAAVNDPPAAVNDSFVVVEDGVLQINAPGVKDNDNDPDTPAANLTVTLETGVTRGTLTLMADGSFLYTPLPNVSGSDTFVYRISDGTATAIATVTIAITDSPDPPVAADDAATTQEDTPVTIPLLPNDTDPDGSTLTVQSVTQGQNGSVAIVGNQARYTPNANFAGTDSFSYTITDGTATSTAKVTVTVTAVNDAPTAQPDAYSTARDTTLNVQTPGVLTNDSDPDSGQNLTAILVSQPANGKVTALQTHGAFSYQPNSGFTGTDTFTYKVSDGTAESAPVTVTITVTASNRPPVAGNDAYSTDRNTALTVPAPGVLANDSDPDQGDTLTVQLVSGTAANTGSVVLNPNGSFTFTPATDFTGTTTFRYRARDNHNADSNEAIVTISIDAANRPPVAVDNAYTTGRNEALTIAAPGILGNDSDPDQGNTITAVLATGPAVNTGTLALNANGSFTFTPANNYVGTATFTYRARDNHDAASEPATVTITIEDEGPESGQVCYDGGASRTQYRAYLDWNRLDNGDIKVRATVSRNYADNTYGINKIGWGSRKRDFAAVYRSDYGQLAFYDAGGTRRLEFRLDYLSPLAGTPSGYGSRGITSGTNADGGMVAGSAANIASMATSMDLNMNAFGYVSTAANHPLKSYSPSTNANYTVNQTYPLWIWDMWYEATVKASTFGSSGFGSVRLTGLHASPAKADVTAWRQISCQ